MSEAGEIRSEYLTVREVAQLLRIKERKVYDLAATGQIPCARPTGKLLFPEAEVRAWIEQRSTGREGLPERPAIFLGSHDPLLEWALRQSQCGLATYFDGSLDGLARFYAREGVATGLHLFDTQAGTWNHPHVSRVGAEDRTAVLVRWAIRRRGLVTRAGDGGTISGLRDLRGRRIAARQKASGTEALLDHLLRVSDVGRSELSFSTPFRNEADAGFAVARGTVDAAFGLETVALQFGLNFVPVIDEHFDLLIDRRAWFESPLQTFLRFCRTETFAEQAGILGGYKISGLFDVIWNG